MPHDQTTAHPFNIGYDARLIGKDEYDNPYPSGAWERNAWQHGWDEADGGEANDAQP